MTEPMTEPITQQTGAPEEQPKPAAKPEEVRGEAPRSTERCKVDEGGALVGFNPRPANTPNDEAALARYMEQWRARRHG